SPDQQAALRRGQDAVGEPVEKRCAEVCLEIRKGLRDRRLGTVEFAGGTGKPAVTSDAAHDAELPEARQLRLLVDSRSHVLFGQARAPSKPVNPLQYIR